jgi:hypothetical protein
MKTYAGVEVQIHSCFTGPAVQYHVERAASSPDPQPVLHSVKKGKTCPLAGNQTPACSYIAQLNSPQCGYFTYTALQRVIERLILGPRRSRYRKVLSVQATPIGTGSSCRYRQLLSVHAAPVATGSSCRYRQLLSVQATPTGTGSSYR